jgi:DUF1680 family protein
VTINGQDFECDTKNGYIAIHRDWDGDLVCLRLDMQPKRVYSSVKLQNNTGKAAVMRGPLVYCIEQADNGELLGACALPRNAQLTEYPIPDGLPAMAVAIKASAAKYQSAHKNLYSAQPPKLNPHDLTLIPYYLWANRGENEMRIYINSH